MSKLRTPEPEGFADFWSVWRPHMRHTDGRGLARETFRRHILNGAEPQDIIDGARWFIRNLKERDREFIPLAATWLNREGYTDFAEKERGYQQSIDASANALVGSPVRQPGQTAFLRQYQPQQAKED